MTNTKTTKRALFASVLSLLLCVSMLVGSTFAWFTDTATTGVGNIVAGTLNIDLVDKAGESLVGEGKSIGFVKEDGTEITGTILWEPGCSYLLEEVTLVNKGNLWAKCRLVITAVNGTTDGSVDLASVIDVYEGSTHLGTLREILNRPDAVKSDIVLAPAGAENNADEASFGQIKLVMQTTAGNEYQGKSLTGITVTVLATQATAESDSISNQYDVGAEYPDLVTKWDGTVGEVPAPSDDTSTENVEQNIIVINTAEELAGLAKSVNSGTTYAGYTVKLGKDIDLDSKEWTPIGSRTNPFKGNFDGQGHTISNLYINKEIGNIAASNRQGLFGTIVPSGATYFKNMTLHNANVTAGYHVGAVIATSDSSSQTATGDYLVVSDIKLTGDVKIEGWQGVGGVMGSGNMAEMSNITVDVEPGSYVSNTEGGPDWSFNIVGSVKGGGYLSKIDNIKSNMDVKGISCSIGGLFGIVGGQTTDCTVNNVYYSGTVTVKASIDMHEGLHQYQYNGLIIGAPRFNVTADQATCTSDGRLVLNTEDGTKISNDMDDKYTWGEDLFGASRDTTYTNKSYAKDYTGN